MKKISYLVAALLLPLGLMACFITTPTQVAEPTAVPTTASTQTPRNELLHIYKEQCVVVTAEEALHLRRLPTEHSEALDWLPSGTRLVAYYPQNDWWMVKTPGGKIGYVKDEFVEACQ